MNRFLSVLIGPELYWVLVYAVVSWFAGRNVPPTEAGNNLLTSFTWRLPLIAIPLAFLLGAGVGPLPRWSILRLLPATFFGLLVCLFRVTGAINYNDSRNSGLIGVPVEGFAIGVFAFVGCAGVRAVLRWVF